MDNQKFVTRPVQPEDWPAIWAILKEIAGEGDTFTYPRDLDEQAGRDLWLSQVKSSETSVALGSGNTLLGSAKIGANHYGPGAHVATGSFIVAAAARGLGVGRTLVRAALARAKSIGFEAMQFNAVASSNVAAIELYRSEGFEIVGSVPEAFKHPLLGDVALLIMHRRL